MVCGRQYSAIKNVCVRVRVWVCELYSAFNRGGIVKRLNIAMIKSGASFTALNQTKCRTWVWSLTKEIQA